MGKRRTENDPGGLSIESVVRRFVEDNPWSTCAQICKATQHKTASVSGLLVKLCDSGVLERRHGCGPRRGYGYFAVKKLPRGDVPSWHDRLDADELV